jgi:GNAT superfamily N-acetyltransferase
MAPVGWKSPGAIFRVPAHGGGNERALPAFAPRPVRIASVDEYRRLPVAAGLPPFDCSLLDRHRPDEHWAIHDCDEVTGHCSLWWSDTPPHDNHRVGLIGHYAADSAAAARALLNHACMQLRQYGCTLAVGPVDGSTWRGYRFITGRGDRPGFLLEPDNPAEWPRQFLENGFCELASYFSAIVDDLSRTDSRIGRARQRLRESGIRIRQLRVETFESDLRQVYRVAMRSFRDHLLFAPLEEGEFLMQCAALRPHVARELVLLAERDGDLVGFCFGLPDLRQAERGERVDTAILKTFGVLPGRLFAGLGQVLLEQFHQQSQLLGYRRVIYALVRAVGHMQRMSRRFAVPFRRYALFAKDLTR